MPQIAAPAYVLIHGGGMSGAFWDRLVPQLSAPALAIDLPGRGDKPFDPMTFTIQDGVASIVDDVRAAALEDVILVAHSSGALFAPGAAAALTPRVRHIVLSAAAVPPEGGTGLDAMRDSYRDRVVMGMEAAKRDGWVLRTPGVPEDPETARGSYGGDPLDDDLLAFMVDPARCIQDSMNFYFQPVSWDSVRDVPVTYVKNLRDRPVPPDYQDEMIRRLPNVVEVVELDAGHVPAVTHPEEFAAILERIAAKEEVSAMTDLYWDPFDEDIDADPHDVWRRMRDEQPLYHNERFDFYALSRYDDVEAASRDVATFSSAHGTVLEFMGPEPLRSVGIIFMDPPERARLRSLVSRAFTPRRVADLEPTVRELCAEMLDAQRDTAGFDYLKDFGARLPSRVISALFGVPSADQPWVLERIDKVFHIEPGVGMVNDVSFQASIDIGEYLAEQMRDRRQHPKDDLMTALLQAQVTEDDGTLRTLTLDESTTFASLLINAGTETVGRLLGWAAVVLAEHPDQRAELAADPSLVPNTVEELLRYEAPSPVQARWVLRTVELYGKKLEPETKVLLLTGSAGRDDRRFEDPDRFDIHRHIDHHVTFGHGIHFCIGAALARLEGRVAIEETLKRFPTWEVDYDRAVRLHTSTVRGYSNVPILVGT